MLLPLAIASCGGDDDEPQTNTTKDPDGTVLVNVNLGSDTYASGCRIYLGKDYNLSGNYPVSIVGPVKGIGSISVTSSQVDGLTWTTYAAAQVGYGYIFRGRHEYYAVYVDSEIGSTSGGVMGYTLKVRKIL